MNRVSGGIAREMIYDDRPHRQAILYPRHPPRRFIALLEGLAPRVGIDAEEAIFDALHRRTVLPMQ